jgi:RHS repeat-associated protein
VITMKDYFGKTITYTYTARNQLSTIDAYGVRDWDYRYNALGQLTQCFYPSEWMNTYYQFDERNRLTKLHHLDGYTAKARWTYDLDDMGNITKTTNLDDSYWDYEYDLRYRLTKAERYNSSDELLNSYEHTYDTAGNRATKVLDGETTYVYEYNKANELTKESVGGTDTTFFYDAWGRMYSKAQGETYTATYTYKYADKMASVTSTFPNEGTATYDYGGDGLLREKTTGGNTYAYWWDAGWNIINYMQVSGTKWTYVRDPAGKELGMWYGTNPSSTYWRYHHHDIIGSARMGTNDDKTTIWTYEYTPYGEKYSETGWGGTGFKFTGALWDGAAQLYHFPFRCYSPSLGRWLTRDPLGLVAGPNAYAYVLNNPVTLFDLLGLCQAIDDFEVNSEISFDASAIDTSELLVAELQYHNWLPGPTPESIGRFSIVFVNQFFWGEDHPNYWVIGPGASVAYRNPNMQKKMAKRGIDIYRKIHRGATRRIAVKAGARTLFVKVCWVFTLIAVVDAAIAAADELELGFYFTDGPQTTGGELGVGNYPPP